MVIYRVKAVQDCLDPSLRVIKVIFELFLGFCLQLPDVFVSDDEFVAVADCVALASHKVHLVQQARDTIHLDHVLNILLFVQSLESLLELFVLIGPSADTDQAIAAPLQAAATASDEEEVRVDKERHL